MDGVVARFFIQNQKLEKWMNYNAIPLAVGL